MGILWGSWSAAKFLVVRYVVGSGGEARRLRVRWEIRDDIHEAFLSLACGIICWRRLASMPLC